ncbi:hypothetical protein ACFXTI_009226 [Malus domestica]
MIIALELKKKILRDGQEPIKWHCLSLENGMTDTIRGGIKKHDLVVDYLNAIEKKFKESEKVEVSQYISLLTTYKIKGIGSIRDHIMNMTDVMEKLNSMDVNIDEKQLVFMILQAFPNKYS